MMQWIVRRQVAKALAAAESVVVGRTAEWRAPVQLAGLSTGIVQVGGVGVLLGLPDELVFSLGTPSRIVRVPTAAITSVCADNSFSMRGVARLRLGTRYVIVEWDDVGSPQKIVFGSSDAEGLRDRIDALRRR